MIFAIEGIITIALSVIAFFTLTDRPETAKWLSVDEKAMAIARKWPYFIDTYSRSKSSND